MISQKNAIFIVILSLSATIMCSTVGHVPPLPKQVNERALVKDLAKVVSSREQLGWIVDDLEIDRALGDAMLSVCQADKPTRQRVLQWLDKAIQDAGGDPEQIYQKNGRDIYSMRSLLMLYRSKKLLVKAEGLVSQNKCPFWLDEKKDFKGVQAEFNKTILAFETGGRFFMQVDPDETGVGAGAAVRLLAGRGVYDRVSFLAGLEAGFVAKFTDPNSGKVPGFVFSASMPFITRYHFLTEYIEGELGPMVYFDQVRKLPQWGFHLGFGLGVSRIRIRGVMPALVFAVSYDYVPPQSDFPALHQISIGVRGAFSLGL